MKEKNMNSVWDVVRPNLKLRMGTNYDAWCSRLQIIHENDTEIIFLSPNKYFSDFVKKNFFPVIKDELQKITNRNYELFFSNQKIPSSNTTSLHINKKEQDKKEQDTQIHIQNPKNKPSSNTIFPNSLEFQEETEQPEHNNDNNLIRDINISDINISDINLSNIDNSNIGNKSNNTIRKVSNLSKFDLELQQLQQSFSDAKHFESTQQSDTEKNIFGSKKFENFVVGNSNQLAYAASYAICEDPGILYNPLFLHGSTGLGKTHLMKAIATKISIERPILKIRYVSAEQFTNEMVQAFRFRNTTNFHKKYREDCDILLMDDVQFLREKQRTQEELFHTFEALQNAGKQIVFTADVSPKDIPGFEERLRSRFESGMMADIHPPEIDTLFAIIDQKGKELDIKLDMATKSHIIKDHLSKSSPNVRELEGTLIQIKAIAQLQNTTPNVQLLTSHFKNHQSYHQNKEISVETIMQSVCRVMGIDKEKLLGTSRKKNLVHSRHIAIYLIRTHTSLSLPEIGRHMGNRDHTTIRHAYQKILDLLSVNPDLQNTINFIEKELL